MSADRELLVLAAKAAGISPQWRTPSSMQHKDAPDPIGWNPLLNDGDALRLAMRLAADGKLRIQVSQDDVTAFQNWDGVWAPITWTFESAKPSEAFRYAIVRAAAEHGRNMP